MEMQMRDGLSAVSAGIRQQAKSSFGNTFALRNLDRNSGDPMDQRSVGISQIQDGGNMAFGHEQHMDRRLRLDVSNRQD
jgi:hypothetical protein